MDINQTFLFNKPENDVNIFLRGAIEERDIRAIK